MRVILKKDSWLLGCPHSNCKLIKIKSSIGNTMLLQKATETPQSLLTLILCAWIQSTDQYHWSLFFWRFPCGGATELNGQHCWFAWEDGLISADLKKTKNWITFDCLLLNHRRVVFFVEHWNLYYLNLSYLICKKQPG